MKTSFRPANMEAVPLPWWTSQSTIMGRTMRPSAISFSTAIAVSLRAQKPSPWSAKAWWNPPPMWRARPFAQGRFGRSGRCRRYGAGEAGQLGQIGKLEGLDLGTRQVAGLELADVLGGMDAQDVFVGDRRRLEEARPCAPPGPAGARRSAGICGRERRAARDRPSSIRRCRRTGTDSVWTGGGR